MAPDGLTLTFPCTLGTAEQAQRVMDEPSEATAHPSAAEPGSATAPRDESVLVERARRGHVGAYELLVADHERFAFRVALTVTRDRLDAEEAAQDAFVKAYRALHRFRRGAPFRPWLTKIVLNEARDRTRARGRQIAIAARAVEHRWGEAREPSAEAVAVAADRDVRLLAAVDALPPKLRDVVTCRYLLELSEEETAAALSIPAGTVKSRLARALDKLETRLGADR
jgi:RNA polymerase sigma factor (sigma-70 family)